MSTDFEALLEELLATERELHGLDSITDDPRATMARADALMDRLLDAPEVSRALHRDRAWPEVGPRHR